MADHHVLKRYEAHCAWIRGWCGLAHEDDTVAFQALSAYGGNNPELTVMTQMLMDDMALTIKQLSALSHAAGQDGEQCRAASGGVLNRIADELELLVQSPFHPTRNQCRDWATELRALSRGVPEDTKRMDWLVANVTETLTAKSIQGEFPHPEHKTQYVLPRLIAWADFHGQVGFREAIDAAIAAQRKEGE